MRFSIATPSRNQADWLELCAASVADQEGADVDHLVQDASAALQREAVAEAVRRFPRVRLAQEPDEGMYDAVNRALGRSEGELCGYLNCDEQYLPGALAKVRGCFERYPEAEVVFGDALVVDGRGQYVCHRQALRPSLRHTVACHFGVLSCVLFFRRSLWARGFAFDKSYRMVGDTDLMVRWLQARVRMRHLPEILAVFTDTGDNLSLSEKTAGEIRRFQSRFPAWWTRLAPVWSAWHRLRRLCAGYYRPRPLAYDIYTMAQTGKRVRFQVEHPTFLWQSRLWR